MDTPSKKAYVRAGELARAAGVSTDTLRHYERKGVLGAPRRSANGYREYPPEALARVLLVRRALSFGFTLAALGRGLRPRGGGGAAPRAGRRGEGAAAPGGEVRALAAGKLEEVESRLRELRTLRGELRAILGEWDERLSGAANGGRAGLLESLTESHMRSGEHQNIRAPLRRGRKRVKGRGTDVEED